MTAPHSEALRVMTAYHRAWTAGDLDTAMTYVAGDIVCDAPAGRLEGAAAYRSFMAPFVAMLVGSHVIAAFGDDTTALIMYDTETTLVKNGPAAECVTVRDGRIVRSWFIFDRLPFQRARAAQT